MVLGYTMRLDAETVALMLLWSVKKPTRKGSWGEQQSLMVSGLAALTRAIVCKRNM